MATYFYGGPASSTLLTLVDGLHQVGFLEQTLLVTSIVPAVVCVGGGGGGGGVGWKCVLVWRERKVEVCHSFFPALVLARSLHGPNLSSSFSLSHLQVVSSIRT